jgi:hypothetical protein
MATGTAAGGLLVDEQGVRWAFGVGAALALVGALAGLARRRTLAGGPLQHSVTSLDPARAPSTLPEERP